MKKIKYPKLIKLFLILINVLLVLVIIKECKLIGFCYTILRLISPLFFGYVIAWLLKPIMLKINKYFNVMISTSITFILLIALISLIGYFFIPIIINEIKNLVPYTINLYNSLPYDFVKNIDFNKIAEKVIAFINNCTINVKDTAVTCFYSIFISYYFLIGHKSVSNFIAKHLPSKLIYDISTNLKLFVRGTLLDTIILFVMSLISFYFIKMPYALLFAIIISITNVIPYLGPYIGGLPAILVALSVSTKLGLIVLILVIILQFIESSIIHPIIMSKSLKINPIFIIIGIIVFSYFFGFIGLLISTPLVSVIKSFYLYFKEKELFKKVLGI